MSFGVYLHFPWCSSKCPYCDFASVAGAPAHDRYARAIVRELELRHGAAEGRSSGSLYVGGGTPSLWRPEPFGGAVEAIRERVRFRGDAELTLEANPGASDAARFRAFRALGFNRLSIGIQSFDDAVLKQLGRRHSSTEAIRAFEAAREAGFENVALDLIYGSPGQTLDHARADAARAASLGPEHLSCYALTLEHLAIDVPLAKAVRSGTVRVPDEDAQWAMGRAVASELAAAGYRRYEISNWSRPGREARHNSLYWNGGEYLGLGCGACGFALTDPSDPSRGGRRWGNHRDPNHYLEDVEAGRVPEEWSEDLDAPTLLREGLAIGLRQVDGVDVAAACARLGQDPAPVLERARKLEGQGLATVSGTRVALSERGLDLHSEAVLAFV